MSLTASTLRAAHLAGIRAVATQIERRLAEWHPKVAPSINTSSRSRQTFIPSPNEQAVSFWRKISWSVAFRGAS